MLYYTDMDFSMNLLMSDAHVLVYIIVCVYSLNTGDSVMTSLVADPVTVTLVEQPATGESLMCFV